MLVIAVIVLVLPLFIPSFVASLVTKMMIYGLFGVSLNIIWGYAGIPSFGHAAFFGVGAYGAGILILKVGIIQLLAQPAAGAHRHRRRSPPSSACRPSGCSEWGPAPSTPSTSCWPPSPSARSSPAWPSPCGRSPAAPPACRASPSPIWGFGFRVTSGRYYYLVFVLVVICLYIMWRIVNSHYGYALRGIHDNEKRMQALGYNTWLYKYTSWIIAAVFGGMAGVLFAYYGGTLVPNNMAMVTSDIAFLLVIMGSATTFFGPLVASVIYVGIEYLASLYLPDRWPLIFGAMFVITIMVIPRGWACSIQEAVEEGDRWLRCLTSEGISVHFGGLAALHEVTLRHRAGRAAGPHRPQRRRQDHSLQRAHRPTQAVWRSASSSRGRTSPTPRCSRARSWAWPARSRSPASSRTRRSRSTP